MILAVVLETPAPALGSGWSVYKSTQMMSFVEAWVAVSASVIVSLAVYGLVSFIWGGGASGGSGEKRSEWRTKDRPSGSSAGPGTSSAPGSRGDGPSRVTP